MTRLIYVCGGGNSPVSRVTSFPKKDFRSQTLILCNIRHFFDEICTLLANIFVEICNNIHKKRENLSSF